MVGTAHSTSLSPQAMFSARLLVGDEPVPKSGPPGCGFVALYFSEGLSPPPRAPNQQPRREIQRDSPTAKARELKGCR